MSVLVVLVIVCSAINQVQFRGRYCRYSFTLSLRFISAVLCGGLHKNGTRRSLFTTFCSAQVSTSRVSLLSSLTLFALQYYPYFYRIFLISSRYLRSLHSFVPHTTIGDDDDSNRTEFSAIFPLLLRRSLSFPPPTHTTSLIQTPYYYSYFCILILSSTHLYSQYLFAASPQNG